MKDYYQILGIEEEASGKEIEARWAELMKQYRSRLHEREGETAKKIEEMREAYEVLRDPSSRREYDFGRLLKRSIREGRQQRIKERYERRKRRLIIPAGIVLLFVVGGLVMIKIALPPQQKSVVPAAPAPVPEAERVASTSKSVPDEMPKALDRKPSQTIPEQMAKPQEAISPATKLPEKQLEPKEKIPKEAVEAKIIPREMPKPEVSKSLKSTPEEKPKVEEPKPVSKESRPVIAYAPASEGAQKPEVGIVNEKEKPRATPKEMPKEVSRPLPKEEPKTIVQEPPVPQPSPPKQTKLTDQKGQVAQMPPTKPAAPIAAVPQMPHPFVKEQEIKQFLARYVDRYTQRDIEGFLSFFSPMAIQNQKDGIDTIRKIYSKQFELYERLKYQLKDPKIEILEKSVKIRASYEIEQFPKKGEMKQLRGDIDWDLVKEGGELKILTIQYRPHKTK